MNTILFRNILLACFVTMGFCSLSKAQISLRAGANITNVNVSDDPNNTYSVDAKAGLMIGAHLILPLTNRISLSPGLVYSQKGFKNEIDDIKVKTNYLDIPLNLRLKAHGGDTGIVLEAGPYLGVFINGKSRDIDLSGGDDVERLDFGWNFGIHYESKSLGLGINYKSGLLDANAMSGPGQPDIRNRAFGIFLIFNL